MKRLGCTPESRKMSAPYYVLQLLSVLILLCFTIGNLAGQSWLYTYPDIGSGMDIVEATNGDVLTFGYKDGSDPYIETSVTRINPEGDVVWQMDFSSTASSWAPSLIKTSDGNYVVVYQDSIFIDDQASLGVVLQKFDDAGNSIWKVEHTHPTEGFRNIRSLVESNDGGLLLAGIIENSPDSYVLKMDGNGALEWMQEYSDLWLIRAIQAENNDLIFCGNSSSNGEHLATLYRTDSSGNIIWTKTFADANVNNFGATVIETIDNGIAYLLFLGGDDIIELVKMDMAGEEIWSVPFDGYNAVAEGNSKLLFQNADGIYAIADLRGFEFGGTPILLVDENGTSLTTQSSGTMPYNINAITPTSNGGYAIVGSKWVIGVGSELLVARTNTQGEIVYESIHGNVFHDENVSCNWEMDEEGLSGWVVSAENINNQSTYFASTDSIGNYELQLFNGTYEVSVNPPIPLWQVCPDSATQVIIVDPDGGFPGPYEANFPVEALLECPIMTVDVSIPFLRRCFDNTYSVEYCNIGTEAAEGAYIEVVLDDYMTLVSASIPYENQMDTLLLFPIGDVEIGECGQFTITAYIDCDSTILGQTHCTSATIYPNDYCLPVNSEWDMSSITLDGTCENDSVYFEIQNIGIGDMAVPSDYVIVIDEVIMFEEAFQLASGEAVGIKFEATGETYRIEANQTPNHPENIYVSFTLDGCPEFGTSNFVNWFPLNDFLLYEDIDCQPNIGSYDPNDKNAQPRGYGDAHFIEPDTEIEYLIRFQNTGTDTAFQVVVRDSLSEDLDISTFRMGVASHPYKWSIVNNNVLKVDFDNIMLPDSNVNEAASHGFFKFNIRPKAGIEMGTVIENAAGIYFDFNAPIVTNTVFHTIDTDFVLIDGLSLDQQLNPDITVKVYPNPLRTMGHFVLDGYSYQSLNLEVYNSVGQLVKRVSGNGDHLTMPATGLSKGMYFFRLYGDGNILGTGQFILVE